MSACKFCGGACPRGGITCGTSECQEADFYANRARNARKRDRTEASRRAADKAEIARAVRFDLYRAST